MAHLVKPAAGTPVVVASGAAISTSATVSCAGANALLVLHEITGGATGGYVVVKLRAAGAEVPHHGRGANIPTTPKTQSYAALFEGVTNEVKVILTITDGVHRVVAVPVVV